MEGRLCPVHVPDLCQPPSALMEYGYITSNYWTLEWIQQAIRRWAGERGLRLKERPVYESGGPTNSIWFCFTNEEDAIRYGRVTIKQIVDPKKDGDWHL